MKHRLIRIFALFLVLCALAGLSSCAKQEGESVPEGMILATAQGDDFRLYVPSTWTVNTAYGISSACYSSAEQSTVSAVRYEITPRMELEMADSAIVTDKADSRLAWYFEAELYPAMERVADPDTLTREEDSQGATLLGRANALRYHTSLELDGKELHFLHIIAEHEGAFYVLSFTAVKSLYKSLYADCKSDGDVAKIIKEFKFAGRYQNAEENKELASDVKVPDGMQIASTDDVAYLFFAPKAWQVNVADRVSMATSGNGKAVISVSPYMPDREISVAKYFEACEKQMRNSFDAESYTRISSEVGAFAGSKSALWSEYTYSLDGVAYHARQVMVGYGGMIYTVNYTALAEEYDAFLADAERTFDAFRFRRS